MSFGVGYRRSDLFREHLGYRGTARGTVWGGYMLDFELGFEGLHTERTDVRWYTKFEHSPHINYFGSGNGTSEANRTSFQYDDFSSDFNAGFVTSRFFHALGYYVGENYLVRFDRSRLVAHEQGEAVSSAGRRRALVTDDIDRFLRNVPEGAGKTYRAVATRLPELREALLGPYQVWGTRSDDRTTLCSTNTGETCAACRSLRHG
jgi:hypothetical protein